MLTAELQKLVAGFLELVAEQARSSKLRNRSLLISMAFQKMLSDIGLVVGIAYRRCVLNCCRSDMGLAVGTAQSTSAFNLNRQVGLSLSETRRILTLLGFALLNANLRNFLVYDD